MNLARTINNCSVCGGGGKRLQCQVIEKPDTVFVLPFDVSQIQEEIISAYGSVLRENYCEFGSKEVCFSYLNLLIQSKHVKRIVATPDFIQSHFGVEIVDGEIGNVFGVKIISATNFLSTKVKAEIEA